ncbi:MAG: hypothetical protein ACRD59_06875, partial [Candidatus Acidiferrales bacterium]
LEGDRENAKALRVASMKTHGRLVECVPFPTFARFECFYSVAHKNLYDRENPTVQTLQFRERRL